MVQWREKERDRCLTSPLFSQLTGALGEAMPAIKIFINQKRKMEKECGKKHLHFLKEIAVDVRQQKNNVKVLAKIRF